MAQTIDIRRGNKTLIEEITELGGADIVKCIQCGKCAGLCPLGFAGISLTHERIISLISSDSKERLLGAYSPWAWACTFCNRCTELCPKEANPFHIILALRRLQAEELEIPMSSLEGVVSILETGHAVISDAGKELRKEVGLPEKPPSAIRDPKALEQLKTILGRTKLVDIGLL